MPSDLASAATSQLPQSHRENHVNLINASLYSSVEELKRALSETVQTEIALLLVDNEVLMVTPAKLAREDLARRLAERIADNPSRLHDIQSRLENEVPEGWE